MFAGIVGAIAGAAAATAANNKANAVACCESRFRSYDRRTGTYLGYDGLRHPWP
ncbi:BA14K family protein [Microvirga roseola]|uniref:BA14K family protein n=1 Tax=Microvirga roseola TaxID=2883126 RepID=UPI0038992721